MSTVRLSGRGARFVQLLHDFGHIDAEGADRLLVAVAELHTELGLTIVHVTHDLAEARHMDRRLIVVVLGKIVQSGSLADILRSPADERVATAFVEASEQVFAPARLAETAEPQ